jgi:hypothetical protein
MFRTYVRFADWNYWLEADTSEGIERLERLFARQCAPGVQSATEGVRVRLRGTEVPRIQLFREGYACDCAEMLDAPERKYFTVVSHPTRRLYRNELFSAAPALEVLPGEIAVLQPDTWPLYALMSLMWLMLKERPLLHLHAAVCALADQALVLCGSSGSGKSTLSLALHQEGADCFGDEWAFFSRPEGHLHVWPRNIYLRPGGLEALATPVPATGWYEAKAGDPKCVFPLSKPSAPCPREQVALFFIDGFASEPRLQPLGGGEAVRRLLKSMGLGDPALASRLEAASELVSRYPCWSLTVGSPKKTAALLAAYARRES